MGETFEAGRDDECLSLHKGYIKRCMVNVNSYKKIIKFLNENLLQILQKRNIYVRIRIEYIGSLNF